MKKIIIYGDTMNLSGGRERVIANLINSWVHEYDLTLIVKDGGESYYPLPDNISIISLNIDMRLNLHNRLSRVYKITTTITSSINRLRSVLNSTEYDYLYVSTPLNAFEAYYAMSEPYKKLVISEHASKNAFNSIYTWMKKHTYSKSYCISVPNKMDTDEYIKEGCNAVYIPHTLTFSAKKHNDLRSKIMLNVGRLTADKQQGLLIKAWSQINCNGWKLWIVGEGEEEDNLKQLIHELNVGSSVELKPARKDIDSVYKKASCFVLSSRCEGFGMVLLEAMAFGVPCISFDCPSGPRDIVLDGVNGFLPAHNDFEGLKNALQKITDMPNTQLNALGDNAYKTIENWDNSAILNMWRKQVYK